MKKMLTGNVAAAWGARLARVDYIPAFPITPQTEIIETLSQWTGQGLMNARFVTMDSEHSMMTAAGAAAAAGVRVFTATSSQGLTYAMETLYTVAGWRVPMVLVNVSRAVSAPITLEADHNDVLAARDTGFIQIHAETGQEILDSILIGYRMAEDPGVQLPVLTNMDGFTLSYTREPVVIPDPAAVDAFLPEYRPDHATFRASAPLAQGVAVLGGFVYSYFRYQAHLASCNALAVHDRIAGEFAERTGRRYEAVEAYRMDAADDVFVMRDAMAARGKAAVDHMRLEGKKVGLLRLRLIRPLPVEAITAHLRNRRSAIVVDQNLAPGLGGILYQDLAGALCNDTARPEKLLSFVGGLGGKDISYDEFVYMYEAAWKKDVTEVGQPRLLYTGEEWEQMKRLLAAAGKETPDERDLPVRP